MPARTRGLLFALLTWSLAFFWQRDMVCGMQATSVAEFVFWVIAAFAVVSGVLSGFAPGDAYFYYSTAFLVAWRIAVLALLFRIAARLKPKTNSLAP
jgi:hypothetical protein